jgi:hypothetical protein
MIGKNGPALPKLFTYLRYNADLTADGLRALGLPRIEPKHVQKMDSAKHLPELQQVGQAAAKQVSPEHFRQFFS